MRKIIIIRGKSTAGKTTISNYLTSSLNNYVFLDIWKLKEIFEPMKLQDRKITNDICKKAIYQVCRDTLKSTNQNIILQETSTSVCKKYLKNYMNDVEIHSFFLDVNLDDALKRNKSRKKETMDEKHFIRQSKEGLKNAEKSDLIINTSEKSIAQIIKIITNKITIS